MPRRRNRTEMGRDRSSERDGNGREDLALSFDLVHGNRSPNRERELSAGELNRREKKREDYLIFRLLSHFMAQQYLTMLIQWSRVQ